MLEITGNTHALDAIEMLVEHDKDFLAQLMRDSLGISREQSQKAVDSLEATRKEVNSLAYVYAQWEVKGRHLPDLSELHISCGVGDEQWEAFTLNCVESYLLIGGTPEGYHIELRVWSDGLEKEKDYWLSPAPIYCNGKEYEAVEFGIK